MNWPSDKNFNTADLAASVERFETDEKPSCFPF